MASADQSRLQSHFASTAASAHGEQWNALWLDGSFLPWDRGEPAPALIDILSQRTDLIGTATTPPAGTQADETYTSLSQARRRKALVPGCGRGYDVYHLQARGWDVTGLDVSDAAVEEARGVQAQIHGKEVYAAGQLGKGELRFEAGDFFALDDGCLGKWDLIWDYTFLCALPFELRPKWALQMTRLLASGGRLVCLEFPTHKDPQASGPPWPLPSQTYVALLSRPGDEIKYGDDKKVLPEDQQGPENELALERIAHFKPQRTFPAGKDSDMVSVWKKR